MRSMIGSTPNYLADRLAAEGWAQIPCQPSQPALVELSAQLGKVLPDSAGKLISVVRPSTPEDANSKSFSFNFGLGEFPIHTDTAFWPIPARYIVMMCPRPSSTFTTILAASEVQKIAGSALARDGIFSIRTTRGVCYGSLLFDSGIPGVRYDPCYMKPLNDSAIKLVEVLKEAQTCATLLEKVYWCGNSALVLDNWKCLHGRGKVEESGLARELWRVYIGG